jgi:hypothetical protein
MAGCVQVCLAQGQWDAVCRFYESCGYVATPETCPTAPPPPSQSSNGSAAGQGQVEGGNSPAEEDEVPGTSSGVETVEMTEGVTGPCKTLVQNKDEHDALMAAETSSAEIPLTNGRRQPDKETKSQASSAFVHTNEVDQGCNEAHGEDSGCEVDPLLCEVKLREEPTVDTQRLTENQLTPVALCQSEEESYCEVGQGPSALSAHVDETSALASTKDGHHPAMSRSHSESQLGESGGIFDLSLLFYMPVDRAFGKGSHCCLCVHTHSLKGICVWENIRSALPF